MSEELRNVAIIAHVDHGKTTLVDAMLRQTGVFRANEQVRTCVLDSGELERERGITILAKHTSVRWKQTRINIIDTPGHADFGGEVERTLMMADGAILLVDAAEGPLPQTRFVLSKALELAMPIVVVINKIDRPDARPDDVLSEVFDLFCELDASDLQLDFPTLYAIGKEGIARRAPGDASRDLEPLFETIVAKVPAPTGDPTAPFQLLVTNVEHDDYVGRLAIGRIAHGRLKQGATIARIGERETELARVSRLYGFRALERTEIDSAGAGEIIALAGLDDVQIGDTLTAPDFQKPLARIHVEEPTIQVRFMVNTSPFAGRSGRFVTSRQVRERLHREARKNLAMRVEDTPEPDTFIVFGRGELMIAILAEQMRREGYEFALGMPEVVLRRDEGAELEPVERVCIDVPDEYVGTVTRSLGERRGQLDKLSAYTRPSGDDRPAEGGGGSGRTRLEFRVPARGLIGYRSQFLTDTRGTGLLNTMFEGWMPYSGVMLRRPGGAIVCDRAGSTTPYALFHLQPRGELFVGPGTPIYEGMIIGVHNRPNDLVVNATREKKLTNIRAAGRDENVILTPPRPLIIETGLEFIDRDEVVEITPDAVRARKRVLSGSLRPRRDDEEIA